MIPIPGFDDLQARWIEIRSEGFVLYGFVLYSSADLQIIKFMESGLPLLDIWSGPETSIFIIWPPNEGWRRYVASRPDHPSKLFKDSNLPAELSTVDEQTALLIREADKIVLVIEAGTIPLRSVLEPSYASPYNQLEVERVRQYFGLKANQYPCVIFFEDLDSHEFFHNPMPRFPDVQDVRYWFQSLFESDAFKKLVEHIRLKVKNSV